MNKMKHRVLTFSAGILSMSAIMAFVEPKIAVPPVAPAAKPAKVGNVNPYYIIVDKSDYELKVYDDEGWYAT
ncbi:MAG: hypothetical protein EOO06_19420, partial [Chitinophagaceae bacterium]